MRVGIIKYNAGNIYSVDCALRRLGIEPIISGDPQTLNGCDKIIFPGVGEAAAAMNYLRQTGLDNVIKSFKMPVLGICIGMQLLSNYSEEGNVDCLGIFDTTVKHFPEAKGYKIPHVGWNNISIRKPNKLVTENINEQYVYYVHSYYIPVGENTIATTDYIVPFSAAIHKDNFYATQFHPEKSGGIGETILNNFILL